MARTARLRVGAAEEDGAFAKPLAMERVPKPSAEPQPVGPPFPRPFTRVGTHISAPRGQP